MSIEYVAIALPRELYQKYRGTPGLQALWDMREFPADDPELALRMARSHVEALMEHGEASAAQRFETMCEVIVADDIQVRSVELGSAWQSLKTVFEAAPTDSALRFAFDHTPAVEEVKATYGACTRLNGRRLVDLRDALAAMSPPADEVAMVFEPFRSFIAAAAAADEVIIWGLM